MHTVYLTPHPLNLAQGTKSSRHLCQGEMMDAGIAVELHQSLWHLTGVQMLEVVKISVQKLLCNVSLRDVAWVHQH